MNTLNPYLNATAKHLLEISNNVNDSASLPSLDTIMKTCFEEAKKGEYYAKFSDPSIFTDYIVETLKKKGLKITIGDKYAEVSWKTNDDR